MQLYVVKEKVKFFRLASKLSEYASRTFSSDLAVFVNFDMLITKIISIFPNLTCVSSTSASKFEISIDAYDVRIKSYASMEISNFEADVLETQAKLGKMLMIFVISLFELTKTVMEKCGGHILTVYL